MRVRYSPRALDDLQAILGYIDERSHRGSRNVRRAIRQTISLIARYPGLGAASGEGDTKVLPVGRYPYLIYWAARSGSTTILHVRHASRERPDGTPDD